MCLIWKLPHTNIGETLFKASVEDNASESELWQLFNWSDKTKKEKLAILNSNKIHLVTSSRNLEEEVGHARNLVSLLLCKDPVKRLSAKYVLQCSHRPGTKCMAGQRVSAARSALGRGFLQRAGQLCYLCVSAEKPRQCFTKLAADSMCDNVLLEWNMALELKQRYMLDSIYPVFIGDKNHAGTYGDYFSAGCHPRPLPVVVVTAVSDKLQEHMDNQGLGAVYTEQATVKHIVDSICAYQGGFLKGDANDSISAIVNDIYDMIKNAEK